MIEPVTLLATFITLWAQLHNYGIDVEGNEYLRNIRVRRDIYGLRNKDHIVQKDWGNSLILNSIYNGKEKRYKPDKIQDAVKKDKGQLSTIFRAKRSSNYYRNNNKETSYIEGKVPLANYSTDSPYYSQNTDGVPVYYTNNNHNIGNGYNNAGNANNNIGNGYNNAGNANNNIGNGYNNAGNANNNIGNGYKNAGNANNNIGNGYNNAGNVNNNIGNGNKLSNQHKTAVNNKQSQGHSSAVSQHSNVNTFNNLATNTLNGNTMQRMSQYVMPSNSLNQNNANNGYQYTQGTSVTSNGYQNSYQGINYPNRNTSQGINSGSRQFYNPFGGQTNSYNQTIGYTTPRINNNGYGINNAGNVYNNGINGYNNAGNWNNNVSNGNNNGRIWNYNTGFVNNNTHNGNYNSYRNNNTGIWNKNLGSGNSTINWNFNGGAMNNNNNGNGYNNVGNGNNNVGNANNNTGNGSNNTKVVQTSYFMSGVGCPEFFKSVSLFGSKVCLEDIDY